MEVEIRAASIEDGESASAMILRTLRETNAKDYSPDVIERVANNFNPDALKRLIASRTAFYVAAMGLQIIGTASLYGNIVSTVMVNPNFQGKGIGTLLMNEIKRTAREKGFPKLLVQSSITAEGFYRRLGFLTVREHYYGDERTIIMQRSLEA